MDDVAVLVVEQCLLEKLPELLNSQVIMSLTEEKASAIASEDEELASSRRQYAEKVSVLEKSRYALTQYLRKHYIGELSEAYGATRILH